MSKVADAFRWLSVLIETAVRDHVLNFYDKSVL